MFLICFDKLISGTIVFLGTGNSLIVLGLVQIGDGVCMYKEHSQPASALALKREPNAACELDYGPAK